MKSLKIALIVIFLLATTLPTMAAVKIAASIPDLASIASYVGGDRVSVFSITNGKDNAHTVEVLPSYMVKVARADLYLKVGLSLDQWAAGIIDGSRNSKLKIVDCSKGITPLEKPTGRVSAEQGDVHPEGNPHYWLDPANGAIVAKTIAEALTGADPEGAAFYSANAEKFVKEANRRESEWKQRLSQAAGHPLVTYHRSWVYFTTAFGFQQAGYVEPVPGIPPTASHLKELVELIKSQRVKMLLQESYYPGDAGEFVARQTGVKVLALDAACDGVGPTAYFDHLEGIVKAMEAVK